MMVLLTTIAFYAGGTFLKYGTQIDLHLLPLPYTKGLIIDLLKMDTQRIILTGAGSKTITNWLKEEHSDTTNKPALEIQI